MACVSTFDMDSTIHSHSISAPLSLIAVASDYSHVRLIDLRTGSSTHSLSGHSACIKDIKWSPSNKNHLASSSTDSTLKIWDVRKSNKCLESIPNINASTLTFTESGLKVIATCPTHISIVSIGTTKVDSFKLKSNSKLVLNTLNFQLAFIGTGSSISIIDLRNGVVLKRLIGHYGNVSCLDVRVGLNELYSGGMDKEIICWKVNRNENVVGLDDEF